MTKIALIGLGKIARDQHLPSLNKSQEFEVVAAVDPAASHATIPLYQTMDELFAMHGDIEAVSLCAPPATRRAAALRAFSEGCHCLIEKPPAMTLGEASLLQSAAERAGVSLFAAWHSRFAAGVAAAKSAVAKKELKLIEIVWREDVNVWHPGQTWIWEAGGFGVFDPGINALSLLTELISEPILVERGVLMTPQNTAMPIAAGLSMRTESGIPIKVSFDWRAEASSAPTSAGADAGEEWRISLFSASGAVHLEAGGGVCVVDAGSGNAIRTYPNSEVETSEYEGVYRRFADLIQNRKSEFDLRPLALVEDVFLVSERETVGAFTPMK